MRRIHILPSPSTAKVPEPASALVSTSSVPSLVNDGSQVHRILLVTSHCCHERDFLEALRDGKEQKPSFVFELAFFDLPHAANFFAVLTLLDRLRSGCFSAVHLVPPAASWSRVRHSSVRSQPPLRSRQEPLGASRLAPPQQSRVVQSACWFLEQALCCATRNVRVSNRRSSVALELFRDACSRWPQ